MRWGTLLNAEEKKGISKRGGRGLAPPIVLGGQPGALLALPKGRYFSAFYTTATTAYMSSFLFLTFCVYVFCCSGLHFSAFILLDFPSVAFYSCFFKSPQGPYTASTGPVWDSGGAVSLPCPLTGHESPHRAEFGFFLPQNEFTPPPKGGGTGFCSSLEFRVLLGSCLWQLLVTAGSTGPV